MSALVPLIVVWLVVLVPPAVRSHRDQRQEFIGSFHRQLGALEASSASSTSREVPSAAEWTKPRRLTPAQRRRRILGGLLVSMVVTLLPLAVFPGKLALAVHLAVDNCFLAYVALLVKWRDARAVRPALRYVTSLPDADAVVLARPVGAVISA